MSAKNDHGYSVGQKVLVARSHRYSILNAPTEAEVVKVGRAWGEALPVGAFLTKRFRLDTGAVDSKGYATTEWVLTPEQYALREARRERNLRLRKARVYPDLGSPLAKDEKFLDALDALVAKHLTKEN